MTFRMTMAPSDSQAAESRPASHSGSTRNTRSNGGGCGGEPTGPPPPSSSAPLSAVEGRSVRGASGAVTCPQTDQRITSLPSAASFAPAFSSTLTHSTSPTSGGFRLPLRSSLSYVPCTTSAALKHGAISCVCTGCYVFLLASSLHLASHCPLVLEGTFSLPEFASARRDSSGDPMGGHGTSKDTGLPSLFPSIPSSADVSSSLPTSFNSSLYALSSTDPVYFFNHTVSPKEGAPSSSVSVLVSLPSPPLFLKTLWQGVPSLLFFPLSLAWLASGFCAGIAALYLHQTRGSIMMAPTLLDVQFPLSFSGIRGSLRSCSSALAAARRAEGGSGAEDAFVRRSGGPEVKGDEGASPFKEYEPPPLIQVASPRSDVEGSPRYTRSQGIARPARSADASASPDPKVLLSSSASSPHTTPSLCLPISPEERVRQSLGLSHYVERQPLSEDEVHEGRERQRASSSSIASRSSTLGGGGGPSFFGQGSACSVASLVRSRRESLWSAGPSEGLLLYPSSMENRRSTGASETSREFFSQDDGQGSMSVAPDWTRSGKGGLDFPPQDFQEGGLLADPKDVSAPPVGVTSLYGLFLSVCGRDCVLAWHAPSRGTRCIEGGHQLLAQVHANSDIGALLPAECPRGAGCRVDRGGEDWSCVHVKSALYESPCRAGGAL